MNAGIETKKRLGLLTAALFVVPNAESSDQYAISQPVLEQVIEQHPMFSGSVIVSQEGAIVAEFHTGFSDRDKAIRNDSTTLHSVASIGKMFTAVAIAQLVEDGEFTYETPIIQIVPELKNRINGSVTVDNLLRHTSGIGRISGVDDETINSLRTNADYYSLIISYELVSEGPAEFTYRNENYWILGHIVERASGQPYESYVRENISSPAQMSSPVYDVYSDARDLNVANHYLAVEYETWWNSEESIVANSVDDFIHLAPRSAPSAGGGAYVYAIDMIRFADALQNGAFIRLESLDEMCPQPESPIETGRVYGRGCSVEYDSKSVRMGHTGSRAGIQSRFYMYPQLSINVVVLSNHDEQAAPVFDAIDQVIKGN